MSSATECLLQESGNGKDECDKKDGSGNKQTAVKRRLLVDMLLKSPRPLKISTIRKYEKIKALAQVNKENENPITEFSSKGQESMNQGVTSEDATCKTTQESCTFTYDGEEVVLLAKSGSSLLNDVYNFLQQNYPDGKREHHQDHSSSSDQSPYNQVVNMAAQRTVVDLTSSLCDIRKLSCKKEAPVEFLTSRSVMDLLLQGLKSPNVVDQHAACWSVINITCLEAANSVGCLIDAGIIPILNKLLLSENDGVMCHAAWALSNIVGDSPGHKYQVISTGIIPIVLQILDRYVNKGSRYDSILERATWLLANICRPCSKENAELVHKEALAIVTLIEALVRSSSSNNEVKRDALWALYYLVEPHHTALLSRINTLKLIELAVHLLFSPDVIDKEAIVKLLGKLSSTHDNFYIKKMVNLGVVRKEFVELLLETGNGVARTALIILSNVCVAGRHCIDSLIEAQVLPKIAEYSHLFERESLEMVELSWFLYYYCTTARRAKLEYFCKNGMLDLLEKCWAGLSDGDTVELTERLLAAVRILVNTNCVKKGHPLVTGLMLDKLLVHENPKIKTFANDILVRLQC